MSRNVSAEIFVVCRDFLAPKHIDPKFFDPKHVFKDLSASASIEGDKAAAATAQTNVFQPEKKRRHRTGYDEGDYILFKSSNAADFIRAQDPITFLGGINKIAFQTEEEKEWLALPATTSEIVANCEDLKVLGKGDFKALLKWRTALREEVCNGMLSLVFSAHCHILQIGLESKTKLTEELTENVEITEEVDEEQQIVDEVRTDVVVITSPLTTF